MDYQELIKQLQKVVYFPHKVQEQGNIITREIDEKKVTVAINGGCRIDICGDIKLGRWVMLGNGAHLLTHEHVTKGRDVLLKRKDRDAIKIYNKEIGEDVWIYSSIILAKCQKIAKGVIIGAGSIVTKNIDEEYTVWGGNPARKIGVR